MGVERIEYGTLADGLEGVARDMGLNPGMSAFLMEYCLAPDVFPDLCESAEFVTSDTWCPGYLLPMASTQAALMTWQYPPSLISYLQDIDIVPRDAKFITFSPPQDTESRLYPDGSIIGQLTSGKASAPELAGKKVIPAFATADSVAYMQAAGADSILDPAQSIRFNSKIILRDMATEKGFCIAPGVSIAPEEPLQSGVKRLRKIASDIGADFDQCWVKYATAAGGGTAPIQDPNAEKIDSWASNFFNRSAAAYRLGGVQQYANIQSAPGRGLVLELDANTLPDTKVVGNLGLQAVIGFEKITYVGGTKQITQNGDYVGCETLEPEDDAQLESIAAPEASKVCVAFKEAGYRGILGVDMLVLKQGRMDGLIVMEANARPTAATPFLSIMQKLQRQKGQRLSGQMVTLKIPVTSRDPDQSMRQVFSALGDNLYRRNRTAGVVPFNADAWAGRPDMRYVKARCAIAGRSKDEVAGMRAKLSRIPGVA